MLSVGLPFLRPFTCIGKPHLGGPSQQPLFPTGALGGSNGLRVSVHNQSVSGPGMLQTSVPGLLARLLVEAMATLLLTVGIAARSRGFPFPCKVLHFPMLCEFNSFPSCQISTSA